MSSVQSRQVSRIHHYVPRFLLRPWATNDQLHSHSRPVDKLVSDRHAPKSVANERDLYAWRNSPGLPDRPEDVMETDFFKPLDDEAARITQGVLAGRPVDRDDQRCLAEFIVGLLKRAPSWLEHYEDIVDEASSAVLAEFTFTFPSGKSVVPTFVASILRDQARQHNNSRDMAAFDIAHNSRPLVDQLCAMNWALVDPTSIIEEAPLLTSDRPYLLRTRDGKLDWWRVPLTPHRLLVISRGSIDDRSDLHELLRLTNFELIANCNERFFSSTPLTPAQKTIAEENLPSMKDIQRSL